MKNIINSLNRKILQVKNLSTTDCNYRNKTNCPFNKYCVEKGSYKATKYSLKGNKEFVRSTGISFKSTFNQHKYSLNSDKGIQTKLSKFNKAMKGISQKNY